MSGTPELVPLTARGLAFCPPVAGVGGASLAAGCGVEGTQPPLLCAPEPGGHFSGEALDVTAVNTHRMTFLATGLWPGHPQRLL